MKQIPLDAASQVEFRSPISNPVIEFCDGYIWIGNGDKDGAECFATLSDKSALKMLAAKILEMVT